MPVIYEPRFQKLLRKLFRVRGPLETQLLDDILPTFPVTDPAAPELGYSRDEELWSAVFTRTAQAGFFATVGLFNPPGSTRLVIVELIAVQVGAAGTGATIAMAFSNAAAQAIGATWPRDGRLGNHKTPAASLFDASGGAAQVGRPVQAAAPGITVDVPDKYVLLPALGNANMVAVGAQVVNTPLTVGFVWRERPTEDEGP